MIKQISFFKRIPGLPEEVFHQHWRTQHATIVKELPGLIRYVQNHAISSVAGSDAPPFDGVAEVWFEDMETMRANVGSAALDRIRADEANFIDPASMGSIIADDVVVKDQQPGDDTLKLVGLINRVDGLSVDDFRDTWRQELGPIVRGVDGIVRYTQSATRPGIYRSGRTPAFDGEACLWFDGPAGRDRAMQSAELRQANALEQQFIDFARSQLAWVDEITIV